MRDAASPVSMVTKAIALINGCCNGKRSHWRRGRAFQLFTENMLFGPKKEIVSLFLLGLWRVSPLTDPLLRFSFSRIHWSLMWSWGISIYFSIWKLDCREVLCFSNRNKKKTHVKDFSSSWIIENRDRWHDWIGDVGPQRRLFVHHGAPHITQPLHSCHGDAHIHDCWQNGPFQDADSSHIREKQLLYNLVFTFSERMTKPIKFHRCSF